LSTTLMKHVRVLLVGVALVALILAMAPSVANAKTDLGGKVDAALKGDGGGGGGADKGNGADKANGNRGGGGSGDAGGAANKVEGKVEGALKGGDGGADKAAGNGGGGGSSAADLEGKVDGAIKGDARSNLPSDTTLNTDTNTDQRVDLNDAPLVGGDTTTINEANSDLVPVKGEAKVDGNVVADGLVDEGLCVRGALNQNASGCGGGAAGPGGGAGNGVANGDGITAADPDIININVNDILGDTTVDSATNTDQRVDLNDAPLVGGDTTTINEANSDLVPARGNADVDALAQADGLLREQVCARNALNQDAGGCGSGGSGTDNSNGTNGIDLGAPLTNFEETTVNSDTVADQRVNDRPLQSVGNTTSNTDVDAPAVPASAKVEGKGSIEAPGLLKQDVDLCATLNATDCANGDTSAPGSGSGNGNIDDLGDLLDGDNTNVESTTDVTETLDTNKPALTGAVKNGNDITAPIPASGTVKVDGNGAVGDTLEQAVNSCTDVNASGCGTGGNTSAPDNGGSGNNGGIDLGHTFADLDETTVNNDTVADQRVNDRPLQSVGNTTSKTDVDAPAVPASVKVELDGNVTVDELVDQNIGVCGTLNAPDCDGDAPAPGSGNDNGNIDLGERLADLEDINLDSTTDIAETLDPNGPTLIGGVENDQDIEVPVPISGTVEGDADVNVPGLLEQSVDTCTDVNASGCGDESISPDPPVTGGGGGGSDDTGGGSNPDDSGSGPGDGGSSGGSDPDSEATDGNAFGRGFPLLGRLLERASGDSFDELASAAPADSTASSNSSSTDDPGSSDGSGSDETDSSDNDSGEPASAANPFERGSQTLAANPSTTTSSSGSTFVALSAGSSGDQGKASASSGSKTKSGELPDTGGITPLMLVAGLLFIGGGLLLVTKRRRRFDS
jgi:LPXTG-motif cell wall-anchored protein